MRLGFSWAFSGVFKVIAEYQIFCVRAGNGGHVRQAIIFHQVGLMNDLRTGSQIHSSHSSSLEPHYPCPRALRL
jgi:hypothetical protein